MFFEEDDDDDLSVLFCARGGGEEKKSASLDAESYRLIGLIAMRPSWICARAAFSFDLLYRREMHFLSENYRVARYSKISLDIVLSCLNI